MPPRPTALAIVWIACAALLGAWGFREGPGSAAPGPVSGEPVAVLPEAPAGRMLSLWVRLDAPASTTAWVVLGSRERWGPSAELYWRRQVHPGWNHLTWDDLGALVGRGPLTVRLEADAPLEWAIGPARVVSRYGPSPLSPIRGLLAALALVAALVVGAALGWLRRPRVAMPRPWTAAVLAVGVLSLGLRLHTLAAQTFWFDEVLTAIGAQSLSWVLYAPQIFGHPPLQYLVTWMMTAEGSGEGWLRAPFVLAGSGSVVALAFLGRRLLGATSGLLGALLLALAPFHVELSQLARPYAFLMLLSVLSLLALMRALEEPRTTRWLWFSALAGLNLYTHYLAAEMLGLEALVAALWLARRRGRGWAAAALAFAGVAVLYLPWLPVVARVATAHAGTGHVPVAMLLDLSWRVFVPQFLGPGLAGPVALGLGLVGGLALRRRPEAALALVAWIVGPFLVLWLGQPRHFVAGRHVAFVMPALMLLVAHGLTVAVRTALRWFPHGVRVPVRVAVRAASAAAAALLLWSAAAPDALGAYYHRRQGTDWRTVASVLDRLVGPDDQVLATLGAEYPLRYYWRPEVAGFDPARVADRPRPPGARVWIVTLAGWDDAPALGQWLAAHAIPVAAVPGSWSVPAVSIHRAR
jgi:hypothetical protein